MKTFIKETVFAVALTALTLTGCDKSSEQGGVAGSETFRVVVPATPTHMKQGEVETVKISLSRSSGFNQGVKLEMSAPSGLQVDPSTSTIQANDNTALQVKITALADAPTGEQTITVKAIPDHGASATTEFKVSVASRS